MWDSEDGRGLGQVYPAQPWQVACESCLERMRNLHALYLLFARMSSCPQNAMNAFAEACPLHIYKNMCLSVLTTCDYQSRQKTVV